MMFEIMFDNDELFCIRDTYVQDIQFLKNNYIKGCEHIDEFVLNYINQLEIAINDINLELIKRGVVK